MRQQRVFAWAGSVSTQGKAWTRASTGPLLMPGFPLSRDLVVVRTLLGGTWGPSEGPSMPSWESRTVTEGPGCTYRGPVFLRWGPDLMMHLRVHHLSSPHSAPRSAHVVGSGVVHRATRRHHMCTVSLYVPLIQGTDKTLAKPKRGSLYTPNWHLLSHSYPMLCLVLLQTHQLAFLNCFSSCISFCIFYEFSWVYLSLVFASMHTTSN
jgi:hypothetical protein